jgi:hypothetical protein
MGMKPKRSQVQVTKLIPTLRNFCHSLKTTHFKIWLWLPSSGEQPNQLDPMKKANLNPWKAENIKAPTKLSP